MKIDEAPLLIAGDVFDDPAESVAIVNKILSLLIDVRTPIYAIPGQHDLPFHSLDNIGKSPYRTLNFLPAFTDLFEKTDPLSDIHLFGFPWKDSYGAEGAGPELAKEVEDRYPLALRRKSKPSIAVVHAYCHNDDRTHPGATPQNHYAAYRELFEGFDFVVFGDNHTPFVVEEKSTSKYPTIVNCGGVFNRNRSEAGVKRFLYQLFVDKSVKSIPINDPSKEVWADKAEDNPEPVNGEEWKSLSTTLHDTFHSTKAVVENYKAAVASLEKDMKQRLMDIFREAKKGD